MSGFGRTNSEKAHEQQVTECRLAENVPTECKAVIKAAVSGEWREPLQMLIIYMSHDVEHIGADMKKGILQLRRTSTIMNRRKH